MGIFSNNVVRLHEQGIYTIPCGGVDGKAPIVDGGKNWQKYCEVLPTEEQVSEWEDKYKDADRLGLLLGEASGIVAFDFDYSYNPSKMLDISEKDFAKEMQLIEKQILALLPHSPCKKVGRKGWTAFYKWNAGLSNNSSCNRRHVRVFDFLAWHKQTIIPPSLHSVGSDGKDILYKWKGLPLDQCLEDLPHIEMGVVEDIAAMFGEPETVCAPSRHKRLLDFVLAISAVEMDESVIVQKMIERDKLINKPTYLDDKKHNSSSDPVQNATNWVKRILKWRAAVKGRSKEVAQYIKSDAWDHFFDNAFKVVKKDIVSGDVLIKIDDQSKWTAIENYEGALRSKARSHKLPVGQVSDELNRYLLYKKDAQLLCDIPKWDGKDRVGLMSSCIDSGYFNIEEISEIFKVWGSTMMRRVKDPNVRPRTIIMKGPQNIGKDSLVRSMLSDFKPYYGVPYLGGQEKDAIDAVSKLVAVHIEEFDQTKNMGIGFLKSLLTTPEQIYRAAFAKKAENKSMRFSVISTANVDDILRDSSGNTRFIVLPVTRILFDYPRNESLQVLAQWDEYAKADLYRDHSKELNLKIEHLLSEFTPDDPATMVLERYRFLFDAERGYTQMQKPYLLGAQCAGIFYQISKELGVGPRRVYGIIKQAGLCKRTSSSVRYYRNAEELELDSFYKTN